MRNTTPSEGACLAHDLKTWNQNLSDRRRALSWLGLGALTPLGLLGCLGDDATAAGVGTSPSTVTRGACSAIPSATRGPFPGDGSNNNANGVANALLLSGIVRRDIRSSIITSTTTAGGVQLTVTLTLVNTKKSCASLAGHAIYLWHCDRTGMYSMYSSGVTNENYLRGVQVTDGKGQVTFTTIFPGCYAGRMPHLHFEVYSSLEAATTTSSSGPVKTSQIAFPTAVCNAVYATSGYNASIGNFARMSFESDIVFRDGHSTQLASVTGDAANGYIANQAVGIPD